MPYNDLRNGRISLPGHAYLITTVTANRLPLFDKLSVGRLIVNQMRRQDATGESKTIAYVVMPDHVHWLLQLAGDASLSSVVKKLKGTSAIAINRHCGRSGAVWQPAFHDHAIRTEEDLLDVALYVIMNPVRAGLVKSIGDYPLWDSIWPIYSLQFGKEYSRTQVGPADARASLLSIFVDLMHTS